MTPENDTQPGGGGDAVVEITQQPATQAPPKSDAEAAAREEAERQAAAQPQDQNKPDDKDKGKRNRTGEYIDRLKTDVRSAREEAAELRRRLEALEKAQPKSDPDAKPTREQFDFDEEKYNAALDEWRVREAQRRLAEEQQKNEAQRKERERFDTYRGRIEKFADAHPDFEEVVSGIAVPLPPAVQLAIMDHESGPEIAYYLGLNEDEAFNLAMVREGLEAHAISRLVSRMKAAQQPPANEPKPTAPAQPETDAAALAGATPSRTPATTKAPEPAPTVGGRAPVEVPPEKLTDDEWFKREKERQRKR